MKWTIEQARYKYLRSLGNKQHLLQNENGSLEIWVSNKNHASFGLIYKNTHLEFMRGFREMDAKIYFEGGK